MEREKLNQTKDYLKLNRLLRNETIGTGLSRLGYVVSETIDNQPSTLLRTKEFLKSAVIEKILIPKPLPSLSPGFSGGEYCLKILEDLGVSEKDILTIVPETQPVWNTQSEMTTLAEYLKTSREKNILLITPWFHTLRTYITAISEFENANIETKVFVSSVELNPYEEVIHSQGIQTGSRRKIFSEEIQKCINYKNLMSIGKALEIYKRDRGLLYSQ